MKNSSDNTNSIFEKGGTISEGLIKKGGLNSAPPPPKPPAPPAAKKQESKIIQKK